MNTRGDLKIWLKAISAGLCLAIAYGITTCVTSNVLYSSVWRWSFQLPDGFGSFSLFFVYLIPITMLFFQSLFLVAILMLFRLKPRAIVVATLTMIIAIITYHIIVSIPGLVANLRCDLVARWAGECSSEFGLMASLFMMAWFMVYDLLVCLIVGVWAYLQGKIYGLQNQTLRLKYFALAALVFALPILTRYVFPLIFWVNMPRAEVQSLPVDQYRLDLNLDDYDAEPSYTEDGITLFGGADITLEITPPAKKAYPITLPTMEIIVPDPFGGTDKIECNGYVSNPSFTHHAGLVAVKRYAISGVDGDNICDPSVNNLSLWVTSNADFSNTRMLVPGSDQVVSFRWIDDSQIEYLSRDLEIHRVSL